MLFGLPTGGRKILYAVLMLGLLGLWGVAGACAGERPEKSRYVAYYFHGDKRCVSCVTIEKYAQEAFLDNFGGELESGELAWIPLNVMQQQNQHFFYDFQLTSQVVVLTEVVGDGLVRWKRLDRVWELLKDRKAFEAYVVSETRAFISAAPEE